MRVTRLELEEFRCFRRLTIDFPAPGVRIIGANGSGKTSVIEALYLLATTKSFRTTHDRHLIHRLSAHELGIQPYARIAAHLATTTGRHALEVVLSIDPVTTSLTKRFRRDGRPARAMDFVGTLRVVLFSPEDIDLVTGSPSLRRRYLDVVLSTIDPTYLRALAQYMRVLEQRNSLLKQLAGKDRRTADEELAFWDEQLVTYGSYLVVARLRFLAQWSIDLRAAFQRLTALSFAVDAHYAGSVSLPDDVVTTVLEAPISDAQAIVGVHYRELLERLRVDELRRGATLAGPHRDDLVWLLDDEPLADVGSRGIQRLVVVAAKLAELRHIERATGEWPVLLLDDVLSELDPEHRARLSEALAPLPAQQVVTSADRGTLELPEFGHLPLAILDRVEQELVFA